ncbi:MAG: TldD/PmbA family protein [Archaeoglobales archaeon]|nr:TldD/PmbA family protein [Archaeoglobales archaeon]
MKFYDIRRLKSESLVLNFENGRLEKPKYVSIKSKAFRVLKNGFWGFFEGDVDDREGLEIAERLAAFEGDSDVLEISSRGDFKLKVKKDPKDISIEEKISLLKDLYTIIRADSVKISYMENKRVFEYVDSCGNECNYEVWRCGVVIFAVAKDKSLQAYSRRLLKVGGFEVIDESYEIAEDVSEVISKLVNAKSPPSGEMNVVLDPSLAGVFIHEAFGHSAEADHVLQSSTVLKSKIGEKIGSEEVDIYDDPTIPEFGFYPFDDEGVRAEKHILVENGILKGFLHSRETAKKLGGNPGNARADGTSFPIVRMSNIYLAPKDWKFDELLEECKSGVYLVGTRGGETDPATGFFQFSAQYGYIIRNAEICEMIRDVSLSGNTLEILRDLKIGNEVKFDPGFCGKAGQYVPVSDGAPHVICKAIVGGA